MNITMILIVILSTFITIFLILALIYNSLVIKRNQVENIFSTVDILLQKRYDLIPSLVATVKGYAQHEENIFKEISELRAKAVSGLLSNNEKIDINSQISSKLDRILAISESYPELKANNNFLHLQAALCETEEQISAARRAYNASVTAYNNAIQTIPTNIFAYSMNYKPMNLFEANMQTDNTNIKF